MCGATAMTCLVLSRHLPNRLCERIRAEVPGVSIVSDARAVMPADGRIGLMYRTEDRVKPVDVDVAELDERWKILLAQADVLFDLHPRAIELLPHYANHLAFIQGIAAGAGEFFEHPGLRKSGVTLTTARGVHDDGLSDFALASILSHAKRFDLLHEQRAAHLWQEQPARDIKGKTVCIVGFGSIGKAISRRAHAFGMRVTGVRTSPGQDDLAEKVFGIKDLAMALSEADYIVLALPATRTTHQLFSRSVLAHVKHGAYLVNVGRGSVVEEAALIEALRDGALSGAALDVTANEPLPKEDPLWSAPNLLLSPHSASLVPGTSIDKIVTILIENLQRHEASQTLVNVAVNSIQER